MKTGFLSALVIVVIFTSTWGCRREGPRNTKEQVKLTPEQALTIIDNADSKLNDFNAAIEELKLVKGSAPFWLKVAGDVKQTPERRRRCVRHFFDHFVSAGMRFDDVLRNVGVPVNWISKSEINEIQEILGHLPEEVMEGRSRFAVRILPGQKNEYHLTLLISFQEDLKLEDFVRGVEGEPIAEEVAKSVVAG